MIIDLFLVIKAIYRVYLYVFFFPRLVQVVVYSHTGKNHCNMFAVRQRRRSEVEWDRLRLIFYCCQSCQFLYLCCGWFCMNARDSVPLFGELCGCRSLMFCECGFLVVTAIVSCCVYYVICCVCVCVWVGYCCWLSVSVNFINDCFMPQHHNNVIIMFLCSCGIKLIYRYRYR